MERTQSKCHCFRLVVLVGMGIIAFAPIRIAASLSQHIFQRLRARSLLLLFCLAGADRSSDVRRWWCKGQNVKFVLLGA